MNKTVRKYLLFEKWLYLVVLFLSHFPVYMGKSELQWSANYLEGRQEDVT